MTTDNFYTETVLTDEQFLVLGKYGTKVFFFKITLEQYAHLKNFPYWLEKCVLFYSQKDSNFYLYSRYEQVIVRFLDELNNRKG